MKPEFRRGRISPRMILPVPSGNAAYPINQTKRANRHNPLTGDYAAAKVIRGYFFTAYF
mgnify:CR=1 FL=1